MPIRPRIRVRMLTVAAAFALAIPAVVLPGAAAVADDSDGVGAGPGTSTGADLTRSRFDFAIAPGQQLDDAYYVRNEGTTPQQVTIFGTDAYNTDDGGYGLLDTDATAKDVGTWISFSGQPKAVVTLQPGQDQVIPFRVDVPADARPGDHPGGIVASIQTTSGQVLIDRRVATRLYARVAGELQPSLTISDLSAQYDGSWNPFGGSVEMTYTVRNGGNVALAGNAVARAQTFFGLGVGDLVRGELPELLPGESQVVRVRIPAIAQLGLLTGAVDIQPTVDPQAPNPGVLRQAHRDSTMLAVPWVIVAAILIVVLVLLVGRWRRARDVRRAKEWMAYTKAEAAAAARDEKQPEKVQ